MAVDTAGDLYIADFGNNRVREVIAASSVPVARTLPSLVFGAPIVLGGGFVAWERRRRRHAIGSISDRGVA